MGAHFLAIRLFLICILVPARIIFILRMSQNTLFYIFVVKIGVEKKKSWAKTAKVFLQTNSSQFGSVASLRKAWSYAIGTNRTYLKNFLINDTIKPPIRQQSCFCLGSTLELDLFFFMMEKFSHIQIKNFLMGATTPKFNICLQIWENYFELYQNYKIWKLFMKRDHKILNSLGNSMTE